ncbi:MAG: nuclear transport factor 2 family protein [Planctomycetota bacterium]
MAEPDPPRYPQASGNRIRSLRQARGWTQSELATRSGFSLRLIQKAEAGGDLSPKSLGVLADTLSDGGSRVSAEALLGSPESVVREFHAAANQHSENTVTAAAHLFCDRIESFCAGDPEAFPFAGRRHGVDGFVEYLQAFFAVLTPAPAGLFQNVRYVSEGDQVVCWAEAHAKVPGMPDPAPPMWVWQRFVIKDDRIVHYENHFDTQVGSEHLAEARARGLLSEPR